ncbi:hypothetical protein, partial [Leptospira borgpetersenii]|uniref:hypothetical protein n=1 Tax=Leptospira borgpetersenii TaxID=174 RepID=UPI0027DD2637
MSGALGAAGAEGEPAGASMGGGLVAGFASKLGGKGGPIAIAITAALAGIATVGIEGGKLLADSVLQGFELQGDRGEIQAQFGFSDAQMAVVGQAAGGAFARAYGASVNE